MFGFSAYHWDVGELSADDRRALVTLNSTSPETPLAGYATHDPDGLFGAYRTLLHSADVRARGVALDQYSYAEAQGRWSIENPLVLFDDAVRAVALEMLAAVPRPGVPLADQPLLLSGWRSALGALTHLADDDPSDLPLIMTVVEAMAADGLLDGQAFWPVEVRLDDADRSAVDAWLWRMATDARLAVDVRVAAVQTLGPDHHEQVAGLLRHSQTPLAVAAARYLLDGDPTVEVAAEVGDVVAAWPDDAPYPASEVRNRLAELAELARARATLAGRVRARTPPAGPATLAGPTPPAGPSAHTLVDALGIVAEHGTAADLPTTLAILHDDRLLLAAGETFANAVVECLRTADGVAAGRAYRALAAVYADEARPVDVRVLALRPFRGRPEHRADLAAVTALLNHDDLRLATAAALTLVDRQGFEGRVRAAAARWPGDAPDPADRVRDLLADLDEVAAARAVLDAPDDLSDDLSDDSATLLAAVRTVTRDGDGSDGPRLLALLASLTTGATATDASTPLDRDAGLRLAWALRRALLRWRDPADARYAAAIADLDARILGGPVSG